MTVYLVKLPYVFHPVIIDSDNYQSHGISGMYHNFFRQFREFTWIKKVK